MTEDMIRMIGAQLSGLRRDRGMSQEELALRSGISIPTYRRLERPPQRGSREPSTTIATFARVVRALDLEHDTIAAIESVLGGARPGRSGSR